jgi:hypothetical protein
MSSESRIWEIRPFGSMRGGSELVIGLWPFTPMAPAYSTNRRDKKLYENGTAETICNPKLMATGA